MERYPRPVCYRANQSPAPTDTELGFQRILGDLIGTRFQQFPPTPSRPTNRVVKTSSASNNVRNRLREQSALITSVSGPIVFDLYIILLPFDARKGIDYDGSPDSPHASIRVPSITKLESYGRKLRRSWKYPFQLSRMEPIKISKGDERKEFLRG